MLSFPVLCPEKYESNCESNRALQTSAPIYESNAASNDAVLVLFLFFWVRLVPLNPPDAPPLPLDDVLEPLFLPLNPLPLPPLPLPPLLMAPEFPEELKRPMLPFLFLALLESEEPLLVEFLEDANFLLLRLSKLVLTLLPPWPLITLDFELPFAEFKVFLEFDKFVLPSLTIRLVEFELVRD